MVGVDGRVRVLDFGLARAEQGSGPMVAFDETLVAGSSSSSSSGSGAGLGAGSGAGLGAGPGAGLATSLTREGALLGTPAYMAPEQWQGVAVTASTDQFSFCVALWEGLYGQRPFRGATFYALMMAVTAGKIEPAGANERRVPAFLRRVLERGLSTAPERRFATMDELLAALERGPAQQRRRLALVGLAVAGLVPVAMVGLRAQRIAACEAAGTEISEVWNDETKESLRTAIVATGVNYAETSYQKAVARIDVWAAHWSTLRTQMCREATVEGTRSPEHHAISTECLEEQRDVLAEILAVFGDSVVTDVERLVPAAAGLARLEACVDTHALDRRPKLPSAPGVRGQVKALRRDLMGIHGLLIAGRYKEGLARAEALLGTVDALEYRPLKAEARALFATLATKLDKFAAAEDAYRRVYREAGAIGLDEMAAAAAVDLVNLVGALQVRPVEGLQWALSAELFIERVGQARGLLGASLLDNKAMVSRKQGHYDEALADQERALAIREEVLGPHHTEVARSLSNVANVQRDRGNLDAALAALEQALAIRLEAFGPDHPTVAATLNDLALLQQVRGKYAEAQSLLERALVIVQATWGADSLDAAVNLNNLGRIHHMRGNYDEAQVLLERALAIRERRLDPNHLDLATSLQYLGLLHLVRGNRLKARDLLERVLVIRQKHMDGSHPEILNILDSLGTVYHRIGDQDKALAMHERVLAAQKVKLGPRHAAVAQSMRNLALVQRVRGNHDEALALALEALAIAEAALGPDHPDITTILNTLGAIQRGRDGAAAEATLTRALAISLRTRGPKHPATALSLQRLGEVLLDRGAYDEAQAHLEQALAIREGVGPGIPEVADVLVSMGDLALARGRADQAIPLFERAVKVRSGAGVPPYELAEAQLGLEKARMALTREPAGK